MGSGAGFSTLSPTFTFPPLPPFPFLALSSTPHSTILHPIKACPVSPHHLQPASLPHNPQNPRPHHPSPARPHHPHPCSAQTPSSPVAAGQSSTSAPSSWSRCAPRSSARASSRDNRPVNLARKDKRRHHYDIILAREAGARKKSRTQMRSVSVLGGRGIRDRT